jgi:hypothetical protein
MASLELKGFSIQVTGIGSDYSVSRNRAVILVLSGRAIVTSKYSIRLTSAGSRKVHRKVWVKKMSAGCPVMQLVDTSKVRPRNKPEHL